VPPGEDEAGAGNAVRDRFLALCRVAAALGLPRPPGQGLQDWAAWWGETEIWYAEAEGALEGRSDEAPPDAEDGPELPEQWDRQAWEELQALPRRLLLHMLGRDRDTVANVAAAVWGTDQVRDGAVRAALSRANTFLQKQGYARVLTKPRGEGIIRWA
jgi:hypothetical protein